MDIPGVDLAERAVAPCAEVPPRVQPLPLGRVPQLGVGDRREAVGRPVRPCGARGRLRERAVVGHGVPALRRDRPRDAGSGRCPAGDEHGPLRQGEASPGREAQGSRARLDLVLPHHVGGDGRVRPVRERPFGSGRHRRTQVLENRCNGSRPPAVPEIRSRKLGRGAALQGIPMAGGAVFPVGGHPFGRLGVGVRCLLAKRSEGKEYAPENRRGGDGAPRNPRSSSLSCHEPAPFNGASRKAWGPPGGYGKRPRSGRAGRGAADRRAYGIRECDGRNMACNRARVIPTGVRAILVAEVPSPFAGGSRHRRRWPFWRWPGHGQTPFRRADGDPGQAVNRETLPDGDSPPDLPGRRGRRSRVPRTAPLRR